MSIQYEVHTRTGAIVYVTNATSHSVDLLGNLSLINTKYQEVAQFAQPCGWLRTETACVEAPTDAIPF